MCFAKKLCTQSIVDAVMANWQGMKPAPEDIKQVLIMATATPMQIWR
jgi:hypothetical protein